MLQTEIDIEKTPTIDKKFSLKEMLNRRGVYKHAQDEDAEPSETRYIIGDGLKIHIDNDGWIESIDEDQLEGFWFVPVTNETITIKWKC